MPAEDEDFEHQQVVTRRPEYHYVVRALEAQDRGAAFVQLAKEHLVPGPWAVENGGGFWWIPHRLKHTIEILEDDERDRRLCRSTFVLLKNMDPDQAVALSNYLNQRPFGATVWCDLESASLQATTTAALDPAAWWNAFVFLNVVTRSVGIWENLAPRLSERWGGSVPDIEHPELGPRLEPDQFVSEHFLMTYQPEATTGVWFARREIKNMRLSLRSMLAGSGAQDQAALIDPDDYDRNLPSTENFRTDFELPVAGTTAYVSLRQADHPDLGRGLEFFTGTQVTAAGKTDPTHRASSSYEALYLANALNQAQVAFCPTRLSAGGWSVWSSQLAASTFIDGETTRQLLSLSEIAAGETIAMIAADQTGLLALLADALHPEAIEVPWEPQDPLGWEGIETNAGIMSLLVDDAGVTTEATAGLPVNELLDPVLLEGDAWALQHSDLLATFGIFNPAGPSVGSLEVAINYSSGLALLLERTRHPFLPSLALRAILDRAGYDELASFVEAAVAGMGWGGLDWFEIVDARPEVISALRRGLRAFGEQLDADLLYAARLTVASAVSPWDGLNHPAELDLPDLPAHDPAGLWAKVIEHPSNVDNHIAYLRSAWEGAKEFAHGNDTAAGEIAGMLIREIELRRAGRVEHRP